MQDLLFINTKDGPIHGILNLSQLFYVEADDATNQTIIHTTAGAKLIIDLPFTQMLENIQRLLKENYEYQQASQKFWQDRSHAAVAEILDNHRH